MAADREKIYVALDTGTIELGEDRRFDFVKGVTRIDGTHDVTKHKGWENLFGPVEDNVLRGGTEKATAAPDEKRQRGGSTEKAADERRPSGGSTKG